MRKVSGSALLLAAAFYSGCGSDDLPKTQDLGDLRVLALSASSPEIGPGGTATITPVLSDVRGTGRPLRYEVESCEDPGISAGAEITCAGSATRAAGASGTIATLSPTNAYTAEGAAFGVTAPSDFLSSKSAIEKWNGVALLVLYRVTAPAFGSLPEESILSFRRVLVTDRASTLRNRNPTLSALLQDGGSFGSSLPAAAVDVTAVYADGSAESFARYDTAGRLQSTTEELLTSFFITDGELDFPRATTRAVRWTPSESPASDRAKALVAVGRDGRGGEAHLIIRFN